MREFVERSRIFAIAFQRIHHEYRAFRVGRSKASDSVKIFPVDVNRRSASFKVGLIDRDLGAGVEQSLDFVGGFVVPSDHYTERPFTSSDT